MMSIRTTTKRRSSTSKTNIDNNDNGIVSIALNNPKQRNALSTAVLQNLLRQLETAKADISTRVVIIKAWDDEKNNNGVFCSGHDLKELMYDPSTNIDSNKEEYENRIRQIFSLCSQVMTLISTFPVPTIAQVDGIATAAGCQLVSSCDLAIATSRSKFATPGVHIGLFCSTPAVSLVRTIPNKKHIMELLLTGDMISAQRAYEIGLINRVVNDNDSNNDDHVYDDPKRQEQEQQLLLSMRLNEEVQKVASSIACKSSSCYRNGLQALREQQQSSSSLQEAYKIAECAMINDLVGDDASEGIDAFLNKRKPSWRRN